MRLSKPKTFNYQNNQTTMDAYKYPRVVIQFCASCKWHLRAVWYLQEIMQTFSDQDKNFIPEIAVQPIYDQPGVFQVLVMKESNNAPEILYKKKSKKSQVPQSEEFYYDGFPDSKFLKALLRDKLFPSQSLGHIDKYQSGLNEGRRDSTCHECSKL